MSEWRMIPGFNGYEINREGVVRSMKNMNADPGHILKRDGTKYTLSDNFNNRVRMDYRVLLEIAYSERRYDRQENQVYTGSRNKGVRKETPRKISEEKRCMNFRIFSN